MPGSQVFALYSFGLWGYLLLVLLLLLWPNLASLLHEFLFLMCPFHSCGHLPDSELPHSPFFLPFLLFATTGRWLPQRTLPRGRRSPCPIPAFPRVSDSSIQSLLDISRWRCPKNLKLHKSKLLFPTPCVHSILAVPPFTWLPLLQTPESSWTPSSPLAPSSPHHASRIVFSNYVFAQSHHQHPELGCGTHLFPKTWSSISYINVFM